MKQNDSQQAQKTIKDQLKSETRRRLIEAGASAFAKLGYHGMKIASVSKDAGIANGTFYLHFEDKQALFLEILRTAVAKLATGFFISQNYSGSYSDRSADSESEEIATMLNFAEQHKDLMRIVLTTDSSELLKGVDIFSPIVDARAQQLALHIPQGSEGARINPLVAARADMTMVMTVMLWWLDNSDKVARQDVIETLASLRQSWPSPLENKDNREPILDQWRSKL
jgi:AcrR family transcriptional regulator